MSNSFDRAITPLTALFLAAISALVLSLSGCSKGSTSAATSAGTVAPASPQALAGDALVGRKLLEIRLELEVEAASATKAADLVVRLGDLARGKGGHVSESTLGKDSGRSHVVLRVPPSELATVRALVRTEGPVAREQEKATDVTDAIADVDARLRTTRTEETRILRLLDDKTGGIADVLAAERALADVRQRTELLESEQRLAQGRVDLATVDVTIRHPGDGAEAKITERFAVSAREGFSTAKAAAILLVTVLLRAGPTLVLLGGLALAIVLAARRVRRIPRSL